MKMECRLNISGQEENRETSTAQAFFLAGNPNCASDKARFFFSISALRHFVILKPHHVESESRLRSSSSERLSLPKFRVRHLGHD